MIVLVAVLFGSVFALIRFSVVCFSRRDQLLCCDLLVHVLVVFCIIRVSLFFLYCIAPLH